MSWAPLEKLSDILAAEGTPIRVSGDNLLNDGGDVLLEVGQTVSFSTLSIDGQGKVLALDHGALYPVKLQYKVLGGDSRITNFSPDEFMYLRVLP